MSYSMLDAAGNPVLSKASGHGLKLDPVTPSFGFKDLVGAINIRGTGGTNPNLAVYRGGIKQFQFSVADEAWVEFHVPHDYVPGTPMFIHAHWSHIDTGVTGGSVTWGFETTYAKGYNQEQFSAPVSPTVAQNGATGAGGQYKHMIAETQLTVPGGSGTQLDTARIEVDGLIMVRVYLSANALTGATPAPFLHFCDIHYQSTQTATKDKNYPFYT